MSSRKLKILAFVLALASLAGCASKPPAAISRVPPNNPGLTWVRLDIEGNIGTEVRWGGVISKVENKAQHTWVEIVRHALRENGRPNPRSLSDGRFIASFSGFVDPVVYKIGHALTVVGVVEGKTVRPIGEFDYSFPVIAVAGSHLWQPEPPNPTPYYAPYPPPWWYYDIHYYHPRPWRRPPRIR